MSIQAYINYKGNCREALEFYTEVFDGPKPTILTFADAKDDDGNPYPDSIKKLVMHSELNVYGSIIMVSDVLPDYQITIGDNISLVVYMRNKDQMKKVFDKLKDGGKVHMELQETFWSQCYGMVVDKFGVGWQLSLKEES